MGAEIIHPQPAGHLYGPPVPHIGFWYGEWFVGEVRGHPSDVETARWKLQMQISVLQPGPDGLAKRIRVINADACLYWGRQKIRLK